MDLSDKSPYPMVSDGIFMWVLGPILVTLSYLVIVGVCIFCIFRFGIELRPTQYPLADNALIRWRIPSDTVAIGYYRESAGDIKKERATSKERATETGVRSRLKKMSWVRHLGFNTRTRRIFLFWGTAVETTTRTGTTVTPKQEGEGEWGCQ